MNNFWKKYLTQTKKHKIYMKSGCLHILSYKKKYIYSLYMYLSCNFQLYLESNSLWDNLFASIYLLFIFLFSFFQNNVTTIIKTSAFNESCIHGLFLIWNIWLIIPKEEFI